MIRKGVWPWMGLLLLLLLSAGWRGLQAQGKGRIKFEKTRHHFGTIKEEAGLAEIIFPFTNTGSHALTLHSVKASCGCTTPIWSRDSIQPGSQGFIKVVFNPKNRPGNFTKQIVVTSDGIPSNQSLTITGKVTPRPKGPRDYYPFEEGNLRFKTNHLTYGTLLKDQQKSAATIIYNQGQKPIRFVPGKTQVPGHLQPRLSKKVLEPGDTLTLRITYDATQQADWGFLFENIFLATTDRNKPMKRINISAKVLDRLSKKVPHARLSIEKTTHKYGTVLQGEFVTAQFPIRNTGKTPLVLRKMSSLCACISLAADSDTLAPGASGIIFATFNSRGRIGLVEKDFVVISNDPFRQELVLRLVADIRRTQPD